MYKDILTAHASVIEGISKDINADDLTALETAFADSVETAQVASECNVDDSMKKVEEETKDLKSKVEVLNKQVDALNDDLLKSNEANDEQSTSHAAELESRKTELQTSQAKETDLISQVATLKEANTKLSSESGDKHIDLNSNVDEKSITGAKKNSSELWGKAFETANSSN